MPAVEAFDRCGQEAGDAQRALGEPGVVHVVGLAQFLKGVRADALEDEMGDQEIAVGDEVADTGRFACDHLGQDGSYVAQQEHGLPDLVGTGASTEQAGVCAFRSRAQQVVRISGGSVGTPRALPCGSAPG
ncbi:hypothetical protein AMK26_22455 [Streptomyces sp. CB03234]|nr:hypothetical protein AMK26_22455 [Streptomyces sp. CB03234]